MAYLSVREWPASEQPREKLAELGAEHLSNAELLAILLRVGVTGQDVVSLSQDLLNNHGGLLGLSRTPLIRLADQKGIGPAKGVTIAAALELGRRLLLEDVGVVQIRSPEDVASILQVQLSQLEQEEFWIVSLNIKNRVLDKRRVYVGSLNSSPVRIGDVFKEAVRAGSAAVVVAHNHPSGDPTPSPEDVHVTRDLVTAGKLLDIEVLDHLIIGRKKYVSLRRLGKGFEQAAKR
ncbi:MAG: RadC family protein [Chloroflexota bacterium]